MRRKMVSLLAWLCAGMLTAGMPVQASALNAQKSHTAEYAKAGIVIKGGAYYYKGARIRIFQDMRADHSFVNSFADRRGRVDIRLYRGKRAAIIKIKRIPKAEADEILKDMQ